MTISFIIPTIGRRTLSRTIESIKARPGDEILVSVDAQKSGGWGNLQRNDCIYRAEGDYLAFIDDDDWYVADARDIMERAIVENPGLPNLFKIQYPNGELKWTTPEVVPGNVSTQMILIPNDPLMFDMWVPKRNMADCIFIQSWKWPRIVWREEIIAQLAHNDGDYGQNT